MTALELVLIGVFLLFGLILFGYLAVKIKARNLVNMLEEVACQVEYDIHSGEATGHIYYGNSRILGSSYIMRPGIKLVSDTAKISAFIPWEKINAIRVVEFKGSCIANLKVFRAGKIDRNLSIPWEQEFNNCVPETVVLIRK